MAKRLPEGMPPSADNVRPLSGCSFETKPTLISLSWITTTQGAAGSEEGDAVHEEEEGEQVSVILPFLRSTEIQPPKLSMLESAKRRQIPELATKSLQRPTPLRHLEARLRQFCLSFSPSLLL